ncbi:sulfatase family protein [Dyadobacter jiangsuensis]|uniref:Arylsulfatase A-like enzyme n=1 Tax=Dyadobacter jiangsuensis TaxID=1591085 RepID=A0A2P8FAT3_9BACT|nr:sulfatase [Dyadobacter jiangsuensis]PSL18798.1 arylsulfatase A-like enzyme [Dyadobacter jiangsuensis]
MYQKIKLLIGVLVAFGSQGAEAQSTGARAGRPNIVVIISDDHAFQAISAYGNKLVKTPNIDRIARNGVRFDKAYVTNSICGPSRAVILTGKYSHKNGFKDNETSKFDHGQDNFAKHLRAGGYQTAWIGKMHLAGQPQGFDFYNILPDQGSYYNPEFIGMDGRLIKKEGYVTNLIEDISEEWLDARDPDKPFCLVIGHKATHRTWLPDTADFGRYDSVDFPLPPNFYDEYRTRAAAAVQDMSIDKTMQMGYDLKMLSYSKKGEPSVNRMNAAQRARFDAYYGAIEADLQSKKLTGKALVEWKYQRYLKDYYSTAASLDRNIGRTLDYLERHKLRDNTIVIYLSDQGFYLGEHGWFDKRFMYEESFRTPLVMSYPGVIKPGTVSKQLVMNLDIAPTLLDAAGIAAPAEMQGKSMLPLFKSEAAEIRDAVYYHYYENGEHSVSPHLGVSTKDYKLIRFYNRVDSWELFDLKRDPSEQVNVYGQTGYETISARMKLILRTLIRQFDDKDAERNINSDDK